MEKGRKMIATALIAAGLMGLAGCKEERKEYGGYVYQSGKVEKYFRKGEDHSLEGLAMGMVFGAPMRGLLVGSAFSTSDEYKVCVQVEERRYCRDDKKLYDQAKEGEGGTVMLQEVYLQKYIDGKPKERMLQGYRVEKILPR